MADFALPKAVVAELEEIQGAKRKRNTFSDETIRKVTDDARLNGVARAAAKHNAAILQQLSVKVLFGIGLECSRPRDSITPSANEVGRSV